jgi:hypothetical protein
MLRGYNFRRSCSYAIEGIQHCELPTRADAINRSKTHAPISIGSPIKLFVDAFNQPGIRTCTVCLSEVVQNSECARRGDLVDDAQTVRTSRSRGSVKLAVLSLNKAGSRCWP